MWTLLVRVQQQEPKEYVLKPGKNTIGRKASTGITIEDPSASRLHAVIYYDSQSEKVTITDLGSTNGTFVNRERLSDSKPLYSNDLIRIGGTTFEISQIVTGEKVDDHSGAHAYTRELVLESLDTHAVLIYEVSRQLNTVLDIDTALSEVSLLMKKAMGAERCEVILAENFDKLNQMRFPTSIAKAAIEKRSAVIVRDMEASEFSVKSDSAMLMRIRSALCVPVVSKDDVIALIYMYKTGNLTRPFNEKDMQLAVAISHQASLTIQRMLLLEKVSKEQRARELFQRFVSPTEVENLVEDYLVDGILPGLMEREVTIMFADIENSSALAERIGAQRFGEILNRYYWDVTETVFANGGLIKYQGDGIMVVFGMSGRMTNNLDRNQHLFRAVNAGIGILDHIEATDFGEEIKIGIGMNTGRAMIGYVGTQDRVEMTAVGDVANIAFRLQSLARPNRLLIGPDTAAGVEGKLPLNDLGLHDLYGRTHPIRIFEVLREP
jgi:class 3 adenylate cyclase